MNLLLFAGTTEGRILAERLCPLPVRATVCVATEYGNELLENIANRFAVMTGRMNEEDIGSLLARNHFDYVIDATHPYAVEASINIRAAALSASVPRLRLAREESPKAACRYVASAAEAAEALTTIPGNVLLATGTKELDVFTTVPDFAERMYPRILPTVESVGRCVALGFRRGHIIAIQGPFSKELNSALMREYAIAVMVTKDGGAEGGFPEKIFAVEETGAQALVIGRPPEHEGIGLEEILAVIKAELETKA